MNVDIHTIVLENETNITAVMNDLAPNVWDNDCSDKEIDVLLQAIMKEGSLEVINWVGQGLNNLGEDIHAENRDGIKEENIVKTSFKQKKQVLKTEEEKNKSLDVYGFNFLNETVKTLQAKNNALEAELDDMKKKMKQFEVMQIRIDFLEEEVKKKDYEAMLVRIELLEKEVMTLRGKSKTTERFEIPTLRDNIFDDVPTSEILADLHEAKTAHQKLISSDDESTTEGSYPTQKRYEDFSQQSSHVKIFDPNSSVVEKFTEKEINKALKEMGKDEDVKNIRGKSTRVIKPGSSLVTPYKVYDPAIGITNKRLKTHVGVEYDPFAPVDSQKTKVLDDWLELILDFWQIFLTSLQDRLKIIG